MGSTISSTLGFYKRQFFITPKVVDGNYHNLRGQIGVVTGSNVGLGFEASRHLLRLGLGKLILAVRSLDRGEAAKTKLLSEYPKADIEVYQVDMSSYDSIKAFVDKCSDLPRLDFAILNAGVVKLKFERNPQTKHEETIQTNVLSTCLLASLLLPVVKSPIGPGKITIVGSEVAEWTSFKQRMKDPILPQFDIEKGFDGVERYYVSKLLPQFYVKEVGKRVSPDKVIVNIVNPGFCYGSSLHREVPGLLGVIFGLYKRAIGRTCEVGSRPIVTAAVVQGKGSHGEFFSDNDIAPMAPITKGLEGDKLGARVWKEIMAELEFAKAEATIDSMGKLHE